MGVLGIVTTGYALCVCFNIDFWGCLYQTDLVRYLVYVGFDRISTKHHKMHCCFITFTDFYGQTPNHYKP